MVNSDVISISYVRGSEIALTLNTIIKYNKGLFKSDKQADFIDEFYEQHGSYFSAEVGQSDLEELDIKAEKNQTLFVVGGRYKPFPNMASIPTCQIYILDFKGVVVRYKARFYSTTKRRCLCDYRLDDILENFRRDKNV